MDYELLKRNIGNRKTQTEVYETCYRRVYASCIRILNDPFEAEDFMHEAFIHAFQKFDSFRGESQLATWICRIAINKCLDHIKKRKLDLEYDDKWEQRMVNHEVKDEDSAYDIERIESAMKELPEGCRVIFSLHIFEEMNHESIAERLGIKEASSRAQYARAKNKIKELVSEKYV